MNRYEIIETEQGKFFILENGKKISVNFDSQQAAQEAINNMYPVDENFLKSRRTQYLDAYRKYQAAVNYGEYSRVPEVDIFMQRLCNKDWAALENVPAAIRYFIGECSFDQSGLIKNIF